MTEEERRDAFIQAVNEAAKKYGFMIEPGIQTEQLGQAVLAKPIATIAPIPGWQPPSDEPAIEHANGKVKEKA